MVFVKNFLHFPRGNKLSCLANISHSKFLALSSKFIHSFTVPSVESNPEDETKTPAPPPQKPATNLPVKATLKAANNKLTAGDKHLQISRTEHSKGLAPDGVCSGRQIPENTSELCRTGQ